MTQALTLDALEKAGDLTLTSEEIELLRLSKKCSCGHLDIFHGRAHFDDYQCLVDECLCTSTSEYS